MTTTFTTNKSYPLIGTGDDANTWGSVLNSNLFTVLDTNLGGELALSVAGGSNVSLSSTQAQNLRYNFTGILTANITVSWPTGAGSYIVNNGTTGAFTLTVQPTGGTGVAI